MRKAIERIVRRIFPELTGGLHLDRFARVLDVSDAPELGSSSERFRPRYAVDLEILTPEGERDEAFPVYEAVPLPTVAGGMEAGLYGFPEPGCLVVIGFAYGRPDHPVVRQVYPLGQSLPDVQPGQLRWQQSAAVLQDADPDGNWVRQTDMAITDDSLYRVARAAQNLEEFADELRRIEQHSTEEVGGVKAVEALGALKLLSGGVGNLSAADNLNLTTGRDRRLSVGRDRLEVAGRNMDSEVRGNMAERIHGTRSDDVGEDRVESTGGDHTADVGGESRETVATVKVVEAGHINLVADTVRIGQAGTGVSLLPTIIAFMDEVRCALADLAGHVHGSTPVPDVQGEVQGHSVEVGRLRDGVRGISG